MLHLHPQLESLSRAASFSALRHQVLSRNLANVNTPKYQREEVVAAPEVSESASPRDMNSLGLQVVKDLTPSNRSDGNNVDVDAEIGLLQQNAMTYQTIMQLMSSQLGTMRRAMEGG